MSNKVYIAQKSDLRGLREFPGALLKGTKKVMIVARNVARESAPFKSGRLSGRAGGGGGISSGTKQQGKKIIGSIRVVSRNPQTGFDYGSALVLGTGIYGPKKRRIKSKTGKVLAWVKDGSRPTTPAGWREARKAGNVVYAASIKGLKPQDFMQKGIAAAVMEAPYIYRALLNDINNKVKS